jgi:multiple sugar transport system ATP-binding protein
VPARVYQRPANRRVAEFFGWPLMNFFDGSLADVDGRTVFRLCEDKMVKCPARAASCAVTLGIRPESVFLLPPGSRISEGQDDANLGRMQVTLVEDRMITLRRGACMLTGMAKGHGAVTVGQEFDVMLDTTQMHWFDGRSGQSLAHGVPTG